jgi:hypothetical protein
MVEAIPTIIAETMRVNAICRKEDADPSSSWEDAS